MSTCYFALTDSHGKHVPSNLSMSSYTIIVKAISGLKWVDPYNHSLSALDLIVTPSFDSYLSSTKAILLLIGTNSVRYLPASTILLQVQTFIITLRSRYPHLSTKSSVNIILCFPCFKPFYPLNTYDSLHQNIFQYNSQLVDLSRDLNFTILDFQVKDYHLGVDRMHLAYTHKSLVKDSIINYFEKLSSTLTTAIPKTVCRSPEAKARRNQRRHVKTTLKQQQCFITRRIGATWGFESIRHYLKQRNLTFAKIPPIHRHTLRIQFNNPIDRQIAEAAIPLDAFL